MIVWRRTKEMSAKRSTQIAVRLVDELTGAAPIGQLTLTLEALDASGAWRDTRIRPTLNTQFIATYPDLEHRSRAAGLPVRKYRVVVRADDYLAFYPAPSSPGLEIDVQPFDDLHPAAPPAAATTLYLLPAPTYPFPSHVRVLRGRVRLQGTTRYVRGALVREGARERVLTDEQGSFALPLRWPATNASLTIDADDRAGKVGSIQVTLPGDLGISRTIDIH